MNGSITPKITKLQSLNFATKRNSNGGVLKYEEHCDNRYYKLKRFVFLQHLYSLATKILTLNDKHQSLNLFVILHKLVSITYVSTKFC